MHGEIGSEVQSVYLGTSSNINSDNNTTHSIQAYIGKQLFLEQ